MLRYMLVYVTKTFQTHWTPSVYIEIKQIRKTFIILPR